MTPNKPSLYFYFAACFLVVIFNLLGFISYMSFTKSVIIPLIFIYYFITNGYKISFVKAMVFLLCFIGNIFNFLQFEISPLGALLSFLVVNLLLLKLAIDDLRSLKFDENDRIPIVISLLFVSSIGISVLSLQYENIVFDFSLYIIYALVSGILIFVAITNYIKKSNYAFLNLLIFSVASMMSDIFYMINKFYVPLFAFSFISDSIQVFTYFFIASYFIANDQFKNKNIKL